MTRRRGGHRASADIALVLVAVAAMTSVGCTLPADDTTHRATAPAAVRNGSTAPASTGCAARPGACGYPDATTTGVQPGVTLKPSGCVSANTAGQVIENLLIVDCDINVYAPNVTVRNVKIVSTSVDMWALRVSGAGSATISHVEIAGKDKGTGSVQNAILSQTNNLVKVDHVNLHHCADCIQGESMIVTDSYIHDMANPPNAHVDGFQCNANCGVTLRHNTIFNEWPQTSAIALFGDFGTPVNSVIDNNLLAGGGYTVYGGTSASTGIKITNNRFSTMYYPKGGYFGTDSSANRAGTGNLWSGNIWDHTAKVVR